MNMKKYLFITGVLAIVFAGCQQKQVDVRNETCSNKTNEYQINVKYATFSSTDKEVNQACEAVNQAVKARMTKVESQFKEEANRLRREFSADGQEVPSWTSELQVEDSVFMATSQYISTRLTVYTYNGGAHGQTVHAAFNYDVRNGKFLTNEDIVDATKAESVNAQLKAHFQNPEGCFTEEPTLDKVAVINLMPTSVCFTFEQYVLGAYACGVAEITVPREALKGVLRIR